MISANFILSGTRADARGFLSLALGRVSVPPPLSLALCVRPPPIWGELAVCRCPGDLEGQGGVAAPLLLLRGARGSLCPLPILRGWSGLCSPLILGDWPWLHPPQIWGAAALCPSPICGGRPRSRRPFSVLLSFAGPGVGSAPLRIWGSRLWLPPPAILGGRLWLHPLPIWGSGAGARWHGGAHRRLGAPAAPLPPPSQAAWHTPPAELALSKSPRQQLGRSLL